MMGTKIEPNLSEFIDRVITMSITFTKETEDMLVSLSSDRNIYLEGNILKVINTENDHFQEYLSKAQELDTDTRKKRLEITKQVQVQNKELQEQANEKEQLMLDLQNALNDAEKAKQNAEDDLNILQQKTQFELIGNIVNIALNVIVGVGIIVTGMYLFAMYSQSTETTLIGNTWSNLFGILLTNSFSIIGTIMGVKYASESKKKEE